ncbi:MAG: AMP phosphorylase [Methanomicrobiales archaeon]|nr:AMP phosphorylase [Methanomicrobiales archaeon]
MKFVVRDVPLKLMSASVMMNPEDVAELGLVVGDRVKVVYERHSCIKDVHIAVEFLKRGELGFCRTTGPCAMHIPEGEMVEVLPVARPRSIEYIKNKMNGKRLAQEEIDTITRDIVDNMLNEVELTAYVMATYLRGADFDEIEWMTRSMINTGETITFEKGHVVDKHSIGGVPGNKISLLIVPIIAASGLLIPKTSSRAITSASGTADTMEVLANVTLDIREIKEITERVGGVIAWGGATNIAPADDLIIQVERHLSVDPKSQLLASVIAKKGAMGAKHVVIDIPVGGTKVATMEQGRELAGNFTELGRRLGLAVSCVLTYGSQPVGRTIGPALEAWEALTALENGTSSKSLVEKSAGIAGVLLELSGKATNGAAYAREVLESGKALEKFREIIEAQGGNPAVKSTDISLGDKRHDVMAVQDGSVALINNIHLVRIARAAGAPKDKGAGILLHVKGGSHVKAGDPLFTIFAEKEWKLDYANDLTGQIPPMIVSGMILESYPSPTIMGEQ